MGKFNVKTPTSTVKSLALRSDATTNYEGGLAFKLDPLTELYLRASTSLVGEPKFYTDKEDFDALLKTAENGEEARKQYQAWIDGEKDLIDSIQRALRVSPEFVLQLAVYCREELHLRSIPLVLIVEYANSEHVGRVANAKHYVARCIGRADEITELLALQFKRNVKYPRKTKYPLTIKKGVQLAFAKFDEYQFAKYNRDGEVTLKDALFIAHPKPDSEERKALYDKIATDTLQVPETWEVMRSTGRMTWSQVIHQIFNKDGKIMNHMAQIRNLRNCLNDKSVTHDDLGLLCRMISDERTVINGKQLVFRYLSAYREVREIPHPMIGTMLDSLETAAEYSLRGIDKLPGTTVIACDTSGSMRKPISKNSKVLMLDIGLVLGSIAHKFCEKSITGIFGDTYMSVGLSRFTGGILGNSEKLHDMVGKVGYSTNGHKVIEYLEENNIRADRIIVFTDCQMYNSEAKRLNQWTYDGDAEFAPAFLRYQRKNPGCKLYSFDLAGYGRSNLPQDTKNVCMLGGWSDRVFEFVQMFEETGDSNAAIDMIRAIKPRP